MLQRSNQGYHVKAMVENEGLLNKRSVYTEINSSSDLLKDFPVLSEEKLRQISFGV